MTWYSNSEGRFGSSGAKGDAGEQLVEEYLISNNKKYERLTDRYSQIVLKIDFFVEDVPIDVKTNIYKEFLAVETVTSNKTKGWIFTTTAEQIYGVDLEKKNIFRYNVKDMLKYVKKNIDKSRPVRNGARILWVPKNEPFVEQLL